MKLTPGREIGNLERQTLQVLNSKNKNKKGCLVRKANSFMGNKKQKRRQDEKMKSENSVKGRKETTLKKTKRKILRKKREERQAFESRNTV